MTPALVAAMLALFAALGGTAGAVVAAAVPLAKRALVADKAKVATTAKTANLAKVASTAKFATMAQTASAAQNASTLGGRNSGAIIATAATAAVDGAVVTSPAGPRPASTAAGLVQVKAVPVDLGPGEERGFAISCSPLEVIGGGFSSNDSLLPLDSFPSTDGAGWNIYLVNPDDVAPASAVVRAVCVS